MSRLGLWRLCSLSKFSEGRKVIQPSPRILINDNLFTTEKLIRRTKKTNFDSPSRVLIRKPIRIYSPGEELPQPGTRIKPKRTIAEEDKMYEVGSSTQKTETTSADLFGKLMADIAHNVNRKKIALEGVRIIQTALEAGLHLEKLCVLKSMKDFPPALKCLVDDGSVELIKVPQKQMETWSSVTTPPGIIGIFPKPNPQDLFASRETMVDTLETLPLTVICDNLREPGNLGSILRSAAGVGCKTVLLSSGCTDAWDSKVLRGGCGAHFQIPILTNIHMSNMGSYIEFEDSSFGKSRSSKTNANDVAQDEKKDMEKSSFKSKIGVFLADSNREDMRSTLPILSYTDVDFKQFDEIYLVVGGETEGLSRTTLQITNTLREEKLECSGIKRRTTTVARLHIPLQSNVESLNVANAFGVIAFEIRRQFQNLNSNKTF